MSVSCLLFGEMEGRTEFATRFHREKGFFCRIVDSPPFLCLQRLPVERRMRKTTPSRRGNKVRELEVIQACLSPTEMVQSRQICTSVRTMQ